MFGKINFFNVEEFILNIVDVVDEPLYSTSDPIFLVECLNHWRALLQGEECR